MKQHTDTEIVKLTPTTEGLVAELAVVAILGLSAWAAYALLTFRFPFL